MASQLAIFLDKLTTMGLEYFGKYYGFYEGKVTRNDDPEERGRVQVLCPAVGHSEAPDLWVYPSGFSGSDFGGFFPPEVGSAVWLTFECGDPRRPSLYFGGWYGASWLPSELGYTNGKPQRRGFVSRLGHQFTMTDEPGEERLRLVWHKPDDSDPALSNPDIAADRTKGQFSFLSFNSDGSLLMSNAKGSSLNFSADNESVSLIDQHGNSIVTDSDGIRFIDKGGNWITLNGQGELNLVSSSKVVLSSPSVVLKTGAVQLGDGATMSVPLGEPLIAWLSSHVHPTSSGPSGPAVVPATPSLLSQVSKTR